MDSNVAPQSKILELGACGASIPDLERVEIVTDPGGSSRARPRGHDGSRTAPPGCPRDSSRACDRRCARPPQTCRAARGTTRIRTWTEGTGDYRSFPTATHR